ncbi:KPNA5_6 [Lepeophtheirus salmonis]|uniref:KPNA5_6 n=1 Tax=Lepeophtheirus salmonis TaxID=72036 RepID=A0A7R8CYE8_LEPSM|nr:KPNA5_6 [Lepeophtheirus salmonis]CAF2940618.1 KPNA5_6 [Lepeophtheirus salmonis]
MRTFFHSSSKFLLQEISKKRNVQYLIRQSANLLQTGVLKPLCDLLNKKDDLIVAVILDSIKNVMNDAQSIGNVERLGKLLKSVEVLIKLSHSKITPIIKSMKRLSRLFKISVVREMNRMVILHQSKIKMVVHLLTLPTSLTKVAKDFNFSEI